MSLVPLSEQRIVRWRDGTYDVRGWRVITLVDGAEAGNVHDLLVDPESRPRYLDVDLGPLRKHVLVPIGQAKADPAERVVWVPGFTRDRFEAIPAWDHHLRTLDRAYENGLVSAYVQAYGGERYRPRPSYAGAVYGPSELESRVRVDAPPAIAPLSALPEYRVAENEADPRGWTLVLADGEPAGRIEELLVDTRVLKVRFLAARTEADGRRLLVPVDYARLDEANRAVWVSLHSVDALRELPAWDDRQPLEALSLPGENRDPQGFYDHPRFSSRRFYGN